MAGSSIIGALKVILSADTADLTNGMRKASSEVAKAQKEIYAAGQKMSRFGDNLSTVGKTLSIGLTAPLVALGAAAVKASISFESAFAGVRKTVDATEAEFKKLSVGFRAMSKEIPISAEALSRIGEAAGQLGIKKENILGFSETMAKLGVTTNLSADEAATSLARLANITGMSQQDFDRLGSTIVDLGNNFATTEREIVEMGMRIAGAGTQIGMSEHQILAYATALSSVGVEAEAGGTAISRVMLDIAQSVAVGGSKLQEFAQIAGMSVSQFKTQFEQNAAVAVQRFIEGLGKLENTKALKVLDELGLDAARVRDVLLRASNAGDLLSKSLDAGAQAWAKNSALSLEAQKRFETTASQIIILKNQLIDVARTMGIALKPAMDSIMATMRELMPVIEGLAKKIADMPGDLQIIALGFAALAVAMGPVLFIAGNLISTIGSLARTLITLQRSSALAAASMQLLGKGLAAVGVGLAAYSLTRVIMETTGWQRAIDKLIDSLTDLEGIERKAAADNAKIAKLQAHLTDVYKRGMKIDAETAKLIAQDYGVAESTVNSLVRRIETASSVQKDFSVNVAKVTSGFGDQAVSVSKVTDKVEELRSLLRDVALEFAKMSKSEGFIFGLPEAEGIGDTEVGMYDAERREKLIAAIHEAQEKTGKVYRGSASDFKAMEKWLKEVGQGVDSVKDKTFDWLKLQEALANSFQVMGISADSAFSKMTAGFISAAAGAQQLFAAIKSKDWAGAAASAAGILSTAAAGGEIDVKTGIATGAGIGAQAGGPLGAVAGAAFGYGMTSKHRAKWLVSPAGAMVGEFTKLIMGEPSWKKAGKAVAGVFGENMSDEFSKQIDELSKSLDIGRTQAALLSITKAAQESGRSLATYGPQISRLFGDVRAGVIPAKEGVTELANVLEGLVAGGPSRGLYQFIDQARQLGQEIPGLAQHLSESLGSATEGLGVALKAAVPANLAELKDQATIASLTFWAVYKEQGIVEAGKAFEGIAEQLSLSMDELGGDDGIAALLGPMFQAVGLMANEAFAGAATSAQGFAQNLTGLMSAAIPMAASQLTAFGNQAQSAFNRARDAALETGMSMEEATNAALAATGPLLSEIARAAQIYGLELDDNTKELMLQAEKAGLAFPVDPVLEMTGAVKDLCDVLRKMHDIPPYNPFGGSGGPGPDIPGRAGGSGGFEDFGGGTPVMLHGIEAAIRPEDLGEGGWLGKSIVSGIKSGLSSIGDRGSGGGNQPIIIHVQVPGEPLIRYFEKAQKANRLRVLPEQVRSF